MVDAMVEDPRHDEHVQLTENSGLTKAIQRVQCNPCVG